MPGTYIIPAESNLYYLNSRYYNPEWGRFINADGQLNSYDILGNNLFAYCFNNPVIMTDADSDCPYNGTAADFHRLEQCLPSLDCTCHENKLSGSNNDVALAAEHHKRGTTNKSNQEKHENGQARKKQDAFGEKGDARRKLNPNKHRSISFELDTDLCIKVAAGATAVCATVALVYVVVNDATGVGLADDAAIAPLATIIWDSTSKVFA